MYLRFYLGRTFYIFIIALNLTFPLKSFSCDENDLTLPPGAKELNLTNSVFSFCPKIEDINMHGKGHVSKLYNGVYFTGPKDTSFYKMDSNILSLSLGGAIATAPNTLNIDGGLKPFDGSKPFYIEVKASISSLDKDHFPAIWMMPIEHNYKLDDVYDKSQPGYEQWLELDIDEGGFGPGSHNTAISWRGKWPQYQKIQNPNTTSRDFLDRTQPHTFGVSYDPDELIVKWWLDGKLINTATTPYVPEIARKQNFYLIISAQTHGLKKAYEMKIYSIKAFLN